MSTHKNSYKLVNRTIVKLKQMYRLNIIKGTQQIKFNGSNGMEGRRRLGSKS